MAMNLNNLKKSITVATVLTIAACLVPKSAQAVILKFSGTPNQTTPITFNLDASVENSDPDSNEGLFKGAVQEATLVCNESIDSSLCSLGEDLFFNPGDLTAVISDTEVQYQATLSDANSNVLSFTIQVLLSDLAFSGAELVDSLSKLSQLLNETEIPSLVVTTEFRNSSGESSFGAGSFNIEVIEVPEPGVTGILLGTGAMSTLLFLKRSKRSRKLTHSITTLK